MKSQRIPWIVCSAIVAAVLPGIPARGASLTYHAVEPCRIVDTRGLNQPLAAGETRAFDATGSGLALQGGTSAAGGCLVPRPAAATRGIERWPWR